MGNATSSAMSVSLAASSEARFVFSAVKVVTSVATLGIVNINSNGIILKDPITALVDFKEDQDNRKYYEDSKSIFLGNTGFGVSTIVTRALNAEIACEAVIIGEKLYKNHGEKYFYFIKSEINKNQLFTSGSWRYKGKYERTDEELEDFIQAINDAKITYDLVLRNEQDMHEGIISYATGINLEIVLTRMKFCFDGVNRILAFITVCEISKVIKIVL